MADIGLQAIKRQADPALGLGKPLEAGSVSERESEQCVIAFEQRRDRPRGDGNTPVEQVLMNVRNTAVLRIAQSAHPRDDIQAKLVLGQGEPSLFFPKLITLIRCKFLFYKGEQAILSVGSCLQSEWYLQQVQGTLL
jgi:hypothetical protein